MDPAATPAFPSKQLTPACANSWPRHWRAQRHELRRQLSALLCCELLPLPEAEHAALCARFSLTLAAYLAAGSQVLRHARQQCYRQRDPQRRGLLFHLLTHIEKSSSRIPAFPEYRPGSTRHKAAFYSALAACCRQLQLRFVLEEQLLEVLQETHTA